MINFHSIDDAVNDCRNRRKYTILLDKKGQCETFFQYKGKLRQLHAEHMKVQMLGSKKEDVCDNLRRGLVAAMENGANYVISLGKLPFSFAINPNEPFDESQEKYRYFDVMKFNTERIFNFELWRDPENYNTVVAEDEKKTLAGTVGEYVMQEAFTLVLLANYTTEKQMEELVRNGVPGCSDNFEIKIVV